MTNSSVALSRRQRQDFYHGLKNSQLGGEGMGEMGCGGRGGGSCISLLCSNRTEAAVGLVSCSSYSSLYNGSTPIFQSWNSTIENLCIIMYQCEG